MSYGMWMQIESDKQYKAIARYRKANVKSVSEAEALESRYWKQYCEDESEKNLRLMYWSRSVALGAKILSGKVKPVVRIDRDEYEHQDKIEKMGCDV